MLNNIWKKARTGIVFFALVAIVAALAGGAMRDRALTRSAVKTLGGPIAAWNPPPTKDLGPEVAEAFAAVAQRITPAVVQIETEKLPAETRRWTPLQRLAPSNDSSAAVPEMAGGSGFIVSPEGYILTNNHVVDGADIITVTLNNKRSFAARVIGQDPSTDVALIKIDVDHLPFLPVGDSDKARVGEWVLAIGNPGFGDDASTLDFTVTSGIISAKGRPLHVLNAETEGAPANSNFAIEDFLQTDAAINPGNSGGPLVNIRGEVIGINTAIASSTGYNQGYAFAVPSNLARRVMSDLLEYGRVRRPLLGISIKDVTQEDAEVYGLSEVAGVLIEDFAPGSPAQQAGIERGDVIVSVDGQHVQQVGQLQRLIAQHKPGEDVALGVTRFAQARSFRIRLTEAPVIPVSRPHRAGARPTGAGRLGIQVGELTSSVAQQLGFESSGGSVITAVADYGAAYRKGVREGSRILEINRIPIRSASDAQDALRALHSGQIVSLVLQSPDGTATIANVRVP